MGKSLKEALLEQLDGLRELGLAPNDMPADDETPIVVFDGQSGGEQRARPNKRPRVKGPATRPSTPRTFAPAAGAPRNGSTRPQDDQDDRERGRGDRRGPRFRPQVGRSGPGGPLAGGPPMMSPAPRFAPPPLPQAGRSAILQQRAEQRKKDQEQRDEVRDALAAVRAGVVDEEGLTQFLGELAVETGALPPLGVVSEALRAAGTDQVREVGDRVRAFYRRPRPAAPVEPVAAPLVSADASDEPIPVADEPLPVAAEA